MMSTVFNRVGPYEILREVGRGGMAVVFLARDTRSDSHVALKLVPQGTDREAREILEAEQWGAELQKQFCQISPHVPFVYEHGLESPYFYVAMEYLDGENLSDVISRGPVPVTNAVAMAVELCRFLEDAHRFEVTIRERQLRLLLHGDLKPRNVRITSAGQVKVLDFGIAKALSLSRKVTRNDFGSVAYLSPERLESGEVDGYADFWALGVLLYEMVTGSPPFQAPDTRRLEQQILSRRPVPILNGNCPIHVQAVVAKLLAPGPTARYSSARAIREDLERAVSGQETSAESEGWPARAHDQAPTRRTRAPAETELDATRRTSHANAPALPDASTPPIVPPEAARATALPSPRRRRWLRWLVAVGFLVFVLGNIRDEIRVATDAEQLAASIPTRELDQLPDAWNQYEELARRGYSGSGARALERSLTAHTEALANAVIDNYRTPRPSVREAQWRAARAALARAVAVAPTDQRLKAALRYCEGHLHRINGEARKARKESTAQQEFTEALRAFREAAELRPGWPDPFLGLTRTFIYGFDDVDRGVDALTQAEQNGYTRTDREVAQLGDGYRLRGEALARSARHVLGMPQERDYLTRAVDAYREAIAHYSKSGDHANASRILGAIQRRLDQVQQRIAALDEPAFEEPPAGNANVSLPNPTSVQRVPGMQ
jgi:tetratricopeptide (TPR) repeat protein/tRNA A-37 threonylcarbamoyl transferase component Bud32